MNFQNLVNTTISRENAKGAREFLPSRLALYHVFGRVSTLSFINLYQNFINTIPCPQLFTVRPIRSKSIAIINNCPASIFALLNVFPFHCICSFHYLNIIYHIFDRLSSIIFKFFKLFQYFLKTPQHPAKLPGTAPDETNTKVPR